MGRADEDLDAVVEVAVDSLELGKVLVLRADEGGRVLNTPMRGHRLARPDRADLGGRVVADREHEIELRCAGLGELLPTPSSAGFSV